MRSPAEGARSLPPRQAALLAAIEQYVAAHGYAPALQDLADALGLASGAHIRGQLDALERKGYIARTPYTPRSIRVIRDAPTDGGHPLHR